MKKNGFSLMEIIIALLLTGVVSISLLKSQWQLNRRMQALIESTQHGFSLAELLISLLIASFLILITASQVGILQAHAKHFKEQSSVLIERMWLEDLIEHDVQSAGFTGCVGMDIHDAVHIDDTHKLSLYYFEPLNPHITAIKPMLISFKKNIDMPSIHAAIEIRDCWHHEELEVQTITKQSLILQQPLVYQYPHILLTHIGLMKHITFQFEHGHLYLNSQHTHDKLSEHLKDLSFQLKGKSIEIDWLWQSGYQKHQVIELREAQ